MSSSSSFPISWARAQFPALVANEKSGGEFIFSDNAAGSQIVGHAVEAMRDYFITKHALDGGHYEISQRSAEYISAIRAEAGRFLGLGPEDEMIFGLNTTNTLRLFATSIGETLQPGEEIIISGLEHEANVTPWLRLQRHGVEIKFWPPRGSDYRLQTGDLKALLSTNTKVIAVTAASNLLGSMPDLGEITELAHNAGAIVVVDGVHYAPHGRVDMNGWGADFFVCSGYKIFGSHVSLAGCRGELLQRIPSLNHYFLDGYKLEIGAQNYEGIAAIGGVFQYLKELGNQCGLGKDASYDEIFMAIHSYEEMLTRRMLDGLEAIEGLTPLGITDRSILGRRAATFSFRIDGLAPEETSKRLCARGVACRHGHSYAARLADHMKIGRSGGTLRISLCHYNTMEEVERILEIINDIKS